MEITVYSTTNCGICHALMQWLDKEDVSYRAVVVDREEQGMNELMTVSGGAIGVPFTTISKGDKEFKISGFDRAAFAKALA